jgi:tRNA 2-thiouridine synthesizing protein A
VDLMNHILDEVHATDPGVKHDIPAWCRVHGHEVLSVEEVNEKITLIIKKY